VRALNLVHHDPSQNDDAIDAKLAAVEAWLATRDTKTRVTAPVERAQIEI
jgi:hypothetical protein